MQRNRLFSTVFFIGTMSMMIVSCGNNNSSDLSTLQIANNKTAAMIESVEWDTPPDAVNTDGLNRNQKSDATQCFKIGNPELVQYVPYLNDPVTKDFYYACYPLSDIIDDTKTFSFDFDNDGASESVMIMYSPNRLKVLGNSKKTGLVIMDLEESVLEDLEPKYIQVSAYDFDDDGIFEMILSVGDGMLENLHSIFRINSSEDFGFDLVKIEDFGFDLVKMINSQQEIELNENEIDAPYGFQGQLSIYEYKNGKIIKKQ